MQGHPLARLALLARRRYRAIFGTAALLVGISILLASRLTFDTDMLNLLPRQDPVIGAYIQTLSDFGANTFLLVAVRVPEGADLPPYESLTDDLAGRLKALPEVKSVEHRIGDPRELLDTFFPKAILFLDAPGRQALAARLSDEGIRHHVSELRRQLQTPAGMVVKELAKLDPLGLSGIFLGRLERSRGTLAVDWTSGYYLSRDHRLLLLLVEPVKPPQDIPFDRRLARAVDREIARSLAGWSEAPPRPQVVAGGPYLTAQGDEALLRRDMVINIVTSGVGVFLLFLFAFRRVGALLYAFVPLLSGLALTFGFSKATLGTLSSATSVVAALLIGLGIDFVIVSYGRYVEARRSGADLEGALLCVGSSCSGAVVAGAATTAATFYAFTFTPFTGLRQMGLLTGTGILFCMVSVLLLLPAMLAWGEDRSRRKKTAPRLYLHSFGTQRLTWLAMRHPLPALGIGLVVTLGMLAAASRVQFDESMKTMRPKGNRGIDVSVEVASHFGSGFDSMILVLSGATPEEVIDLSDRAAAGAQKLIDQGVLYRTSGVTSLIPPPRHQAEALDWLERQRGGALDFARIRATFGQALAEQGLRAAPFAPGLDLLGRAINLTGPIGLADFDSTQETRLLLGRYLKKTDSGWRAALYLYPPGNRFRREPPQEAVALAHDLGPAAVLSGVNVINQRVRALVLRDAWIAGFLGLGLVALLLWLDFRRLSDVLLALAPLLVGIIWMVGGMVLLGIQMNFFNIFVTTMIIGIGVDYGIYILHRYRESRDLPREPFEKAIRETGKAVAAAALSTIVGFGSISFSHYPGLRSTGEVAILGALSTALVAITLLPAWLSRRETRRREERERKAA
ncbi:MAG TPA: MMPL family transporter [Thermoanaerobaculia bacterium]|nr:MMPL family transporter [Thermoanaerobaculia bacterium]